MLNEIETGITRLQDGNKAVFSNNPHKIYTAAPIELIEEPHKLRKNKNRPFESPIVLDIDKEIRRLNVEGLNSLQISAELAKQGTLMTWQRIQRRLRFLNKKKPDDEAPHSPRTKSESPTLQRWHPAKMPTAIKQAENQDLSSDLIERIIMLSIQRLAPHSISDALEEECGAILSESQIMDIIVRKARGEI